jgi:proteasome lid subunit RPN8/RPN11
MLQMPRKILDSILHEVKNAYPNECCGLLIGHTGDSQKNVVRLHPITNINESRMRDRYEMDPKELEAADKHARGESQEIVGIYHSHPDHPSRPSAFDRERAWPVYSYLIVAVEKGVRFEAQSWVIEDWEGDFREEIITISRA